jgi:hypothetical protein
MLAGRPLEAAGNGSPRWMTAGPRERAHRTRPTGRLARLSRPVTPSSRPSRRSGSGPGSPREPAHARPGLAMVFKLIEAASERWRYVARMYSVRSVAASASAGTSSTRPPAEGVTPGQPCGQRGDPIRSPPGTRHRQARVARRPPCGRRRHGPHPPRQRFPPYGGGPLPGPVRGVRDAAYRRPGGLRRQSGDPGECGIAPAVCLPANP